MDRTVHIRPVEAADLDQIASIERVSIVHGWNRDNFREALSNPQVIALCAVSSDAPEVVRGYLFLYHAADEGEIPTIAVAPSARRCGVASRLLRAAAQAGYRVGVRRIYLEVRESNTVARALYEGQHFTDIGRRPGFYSDPREDAVEMRCELSEQTV